MVEAHDHSVVVRAAWISTQFRAMLEKNPASIREVSRRVLVGLAFAGFRKVRAGDMSYGWSWPNRRSIV
jgi:hypothetical protein